MWLKIALIAFAITLAASMLIMMPLLRKYHKKYDAMPLEPGPEGWHDIDAEDEQEAREAAEKGWQDWDEESRAEWDNWDNWCKPENAGHSSNDKM